MAFRLLGPMAVEGPRGPVALGGLKQRGLLALLLLHANETVSRELLIDELWGDEPPATVEAGLHVYISRVRKVLEESGAEAAVSREGRGYRLHVDADRIDAHRFARLVAEGADALAINDARRAAQLLRRALTLWRGPALADFDREGFARRHGVRLEEVRAAALENRLAAELSLGRHREVIPELKALIETHPHRERLRSQLIVALYRAGRQADALEAYGAARRSLDELGLEPGEELRALQRAILEQDPVLSEPARAPPAAHSRRRATSTRVVAGLAVLVGAGLVAGALLAWPNSSAAPPAVVPNSVALIDPDENEIRAVIPVGARPNGMHAGEGSLWVGIHEDMVVVRIDPRERRIVRALSVGVATNRIQARDGSVWVTSFFHDRVVRLDPEANEARTFRLPPARGAVPFSEDQTPGPLGLAVGERSVWVARGRVILRLDARSGRVEQRIRLAAPPKELALGGGALWATLMGETSVVKIDPSTGSVLGSNAVGLPGDDLGLMAVGAGAVWVVSDSPDSPTPGTVWRIDPTTGRVTDAIRVGQHPIGIAVGAGGVWVANLGDGTVSRIDPGRRVVVASIPVRQGAVDLAAGEEGVWVGVAE